MNSAPRNRPPFRRRAAPTDRRRPFPGPRPEWRERDQRPAPPRYGRRPAPRLEVPPDPRVWTAAARVVERCDREHPADQVLRLQTRGESGIDRPAARAVSRAVFAFFRWRNWLREAQPLPLRIREATERAAAFAAKAGSVPAAELLARAVPAWVAEQCAVSPEWLRALQSEPVLWLRTHRGQAATVARQLSGVIPGKLPDSLRYGGEEDLFRHPLFHSGEFEIQDIASLAVGLVCAPRAGQTWWDACAGEGGKLLHLSDLMDNKGLIWASDRAAWRLQLLKRRAARARCFNYRAVAWDGGPRLPTRTRFDGVLVDAPCSGLGTWSRNPHARWTTSPQDVRELAGVQLDLLSHSAAAVKPGGRLVYAVCTLTRSETSGVSEGFETRHREFQPLPFPNPLAPNQSPRARQLWWPQETGGNGMFVAAWQRTA